jgi:hypothetical protein
MSRRPSFFEHLHPPTIPAREARFRYTLGLGGTSLFLFFILSLTGLLEVFYYLPTVEEANASAHVIDLLVPYGWVVRGVHFWAGQGIVVAAALHMIRVVLTGAYRKPRRFNWLLGLALLASMLLLDFTGLVLRWDMDIAWALMVGTNLLKSIPLLGPALYTLTVGGSEIGPPTVVRFLAWHILGLALPAAILIAWHLFRVRRDGGISHIEAPAVPIPAPASERIPRAELVRREAIAALLAGALLLALALLVVLRQPNSSTCRQTPRPLVLPLGPTASAPRGSVPDGRRDPRRGRVGTGPHPICRGSPERGCGHLVQSRGQARPGYRPRTARIDRGTHPPGSFGMMRIQQRLTRRGVLKLSLAGSGLLSLYGLARFLSRAEPPPAPQQFALGYPAEYPVGAVASIPEAGAILIHDEVA